MVLRKWSLVNCWMSISPFSNVYGKRLQGSYAGACGFQTRIVQVEEMSNTGENDFDVCWAAVDQSLTGNDIKRNTLSRNLGIYFHWLKFVVTQIISMSQVRTLLRKQKNSLLQNFHFFWKHQTKFFGVLRTSPKTQSRHLIQFSNWSWGSSGIHTVYDLHQWSSTMTNEIINRHVCWRHSHLFLCH